MKKRKFIKENLDNNDPDIYNFERNISSKEEQGEYSNHIYVGESNSKEQLYDRKNPIVRMILLILGLIAFIGTIYYVLTGIGII